jgi:hypothetical protein
MVILISAISLITTLIGLYYIGEKNKWGFVYHTISVGIQGYLFFVLSNWFLVIQMIILAVFNIRNYIKWRSEDVG